MISSSIRRRLCVLAATGAVMAIGAPAAGAATFAPANHNFGSVTVGATSPQKAFVLTNGCAVTNPIGGGCLFPQFTSTVPVGATGDFVVANDTCPDPPFGLLTSNGATCTANVTFTPTAAGPRNGTVTVGAFSAILTGTGVAPATPPPGGTVSPGAGGTQGVAGGKKRCKKGKSAAAAKKKCKRKKKK